MEWLDKLRKIKDQLDFAADTGADYLRKAAAALRKTADAAEEAADSIDPTPGEISTRAEVTKAEEFLAECEAEMTRPASRAGGAIIGILLPIFIDIVKKWLEKRTGGRAA